jgi:poly(ADP-ribose) glycohydrolase
MMSTHVHLPHADSENWLRVKEQLSQPEQISNVHQLACVIKTIKPDITPDIMEHFNLTGLQKLIDENQIPFFTRIFPFMCTLALDLENLFPSGTIEQLIPGMDHKIDLTRRQAACLLANAFFCTFTGDLCDFHFAFILSSYRHAEYDGSSQYNKVRCIIHYFDRLSRDSFPNDEFITYHRRVIKQSPSWSSSSAPLCDLVIRKEGSIDDATDSTMIDFANEYLGGGVLQMGCAQEEIIFITHPECIPAILLTKDKMQANETVGITGVRRYCRYQGYVSTFQFLGDYNEEENEKREFVAMDAVPFLMDYDAQYSTEMIKRETLKAFCGFTGSEDKPIATGNWGCGSFGGAAQLKSLIQWIAASEARRPICYYVFEKHEMGEELKKMKEIFNQQEEKMTVKKLWKSMVDFNKMKGTSDLFTHVMKELKLS